MELVNIDEVVAQARNKVIGSYETNYGANVDYAKALNEKWSGFDWFELRYDDTSDLGKAVRAEGDLFRKGIKAWHSNPSTAWKQIRDHARKAKYGQPVIEGSAEGAEGAEVSGSPKRNRSPMLRNIEELTELFIFNRKNENADDKLKQCQVHIGKALEALGVDLNMIK